MQNGNTNKAPQLTPAPLARHLQFHGAARREMLGGFQKNAENRRRKACHNSAAPIPEADNGQQRKRQVSGEMHQLMGESAGNNSPTMQALDAAQRIKSASACCHSRAVRVERRLWSEPHDLGGRQTFQRIPGVDDRSRALKADRRFGSA